MIISGKYFHMEISGLKIMQQLLLKFYAMLSRFLDVFRYLPRRVGRLFDHIQLGAQSFWTNSIQSLFRWNTMLGIGYWWLEFFMMLLECLGIAELFETVMDFVKFNCRPLNRWEKELAYSVFGDSINYDRVRIDELALIGPRQGMFCYVSFYMINSWGNMQNSVLLHELVHVWQFEHLGISYIPRALYAQRTQMGYNYGGVSQLKTFCEAGKSLKDFNMEQQADIITDYYRIKNGYRPQWGNGGIIDLPVYEYFAAQLRQLTP